jgi:hypothetical protein
LRSGREASPPAPRERPLQQAPHQRAERGRNRAFPQKKPLHSLDVSLLGGQWPTSGGAVVSRGALGGSVVEPRDGFSYPLGQQLLQRGDAVCGLSVDYGGAGKRPSAGNYQIELV